MKKLLLSATFVAMTCGLAMAQNAANPQASDTPSAASATASSKPMTSQQVKMKKKKMTKGMSNKGKAMGPETGSAKDTGGSAPAR